MRERESETKKKDTCSVFTAQIHSHNTPNSFFYTQPHVLHASPQQQQPFFSSLDGSNNGNIGTELAPSWMVDTVLGARLLFLLPVAAACVGGALHPAEVGARVSGWVFS